MPEISDAELAELQQAHGLLKSLYADNAVGFDFRKIVKKKYPNASIPELDTLSRVEEQGSALDKRFEEATSGLEKKIDGFLADRAKEKEDQDVQAFSARIDKIAKDRGYTKEGTEKLLGIMKDRGIHNPEDAAIIFESTQPKAAPKPREFSSRMQFVSPEGKDDESYNQLMSDPDGWMADQLLNAPELQGSNE